MTRYIALLRAVNVGGTGKLLMTDLKALCTGAGFARVETYIASGNVVFESQASPARVKSEIESRLMAHAGKPIGVLLRTAAEMRAVLDANPFPRTAPRNYTYVFFFDAPPPKDVARSAIGVADEKIRMGTRELYVHYPNGMGQSALRIPAARHGTARNLNTVARLVAMTSRP
jgi:uncharacterized protein (DUF1697 family)